MGGLDHYWELVRKYPLLPGRFSSGTSSTRGLSATSPTAVCRSSTAAISNDYDATDNSFNCNGIIAPDRTWHPHAYEVQRQYQSIWTTPVDLAQGRVEVYNENFFIGLDAYEMEWQLLADGRVVKAGRIGDLDVAPQQRRAYELGFTAAEFLPAGEGNPGERGLINSKRSSRCSTSAIRWPNSSSSYASTTVRPVFRPCGLGASRRGDPLGTRLCASKGYVADVLLARRVFWLPIRSTAVS